MLLTFFFCPFRWIIFVFVFSVCFHLSFFPFFCFHIWLSVALLFFALFLVPLFFFSPSVGFQPFVIHSPHLFLFFSLVFVGVASRVSLFHPLFLSESTLFYVVIFVVAAAFCHVCACSFLIFFFRDAGSVTRSFGSKGVRSRLSGTNKKSKARFCLSFNIAPLPLFSSFLFFFVVLFCSTLVSVRVVEPVEIVAYPNMFSKFPNEKRGHTHSSVWSQATAPSPFLFFLSIPCLALRQHMRM